MKSTRKMTNTMKSTRKMTNTIFAMFLGLLVITASNQTFAQGGTWETKTPMLTARWGAVDGVINGKLYVAGGWNGTNSLATLEVYDPATNTWATKAPMPTARNGVGGGVINGKLYVVGGDIAQAQKLATLEVYDPATNTWATKAPMPTPRSSPGAVAIDGKLYVVGGCLGWCAPVTAALEVYDPATNTWATKTPMPTTRGGADVEVVNGLFYVMGGCCGSVASQSELMAKTIEVYNPTTNTWTTKTQHLVGADDTAGSINGKIYVAKFAATEVYDPATDTWASLSPMPITRQYAAGGVINGKLYVVGGYDGTVGSATLEAFTPFMNVSFDTVQKIYIGYYQRPADPAGLIYWAGRLASSGGNLNEIIEAFSNSPESRALYGTINSSNISTVVNDIYNALLARDAEPAGLAYWVGEFNSGRITAASIMLSLLNGAQNEDLQTVNNRLTAANLFTRTIDPDLDGSNFQATYAGDGDAVAGRNFLAFVTSNPVTVPTQDGTTAYIRTNIADPGDAIGGSPFTQLVINSLSTTSAVPASLLTISGSGFDPENSAISVLFTPNGSGAPIAVPVFSASANSINVIVPPFLDRTSGFSSGVMTVQAIQVSGSSLMTSNTIGGLNVGSLPSIPTSDPAGAVTGAWINSGLIVLQNIQTFAGSTPSYADLLSASNALGSDMNSSLQAINSIKANPTQTKNLTTLNGNPFVLDAATLAASDRLVVAYLQQFLNFVQTPPAASPASVVLRRSALATGCIVGDMDPNYGTMICDGRTYNQQFAQVGSAILPAAAAFVYGQWLSLAGAVGAAGFLAAGVSEAAVNAFQLVWAASGPYVSALAAGGPAPPLKEPATEVAITLIDNVLNGTGNVLSGVLFGADLVSKANQVSSAPMGSAPKGGLIIFDPSTQPPTGSSALLRVQGFGANASVLSVMAPKSQAAVSLCTFSYSDWSACQSNNTQTRAVLSSNPAGCSGTPILSQSCTYTPQTCTYTYSDWSACQSNNTQTRVVLSSSPVGCTGTPVLTQSCNYTPTPVCGDGICDRPGGENISNCPSDCTAFCGDGICSYGEDQITCPSDCQSTSSCCISTNNCPGETLYECGATCCCCPYGSRCNSNSICSN